MADLDAAGVEQGLLDQRVGQGAGLAADGEVDRLDQDARLLLLVGLGEPDDRSAEGRGRPRVVVAVEAAEATAGDEERCRLDDLVEQGMQRHDPSTKGLTPHVQVQGLERPLVVQGRQPVHARERLLRGPLGHLGQQVIGCRAGVDRQHLGTALGQFRGEGRTHASLVEEDEDARRPHPGRRR